MTDQTRSLYIEDLQSWMDEQFFSGVFNNLGYGSLLTKIKIMKSKHPGNLKNFGFLEFNNRSTALNVLQVLNGTLIPNTQKAFKLKKGAKLSETQQQIQIYVGGFDTSVTNTMLMEFFQAQYPSVISAKIQFDKITKVSKAFGFVHFMNQLQAQKAIQQKNGTFFNGKRLTVAQSKRNNKLQTAVNQNPFTPVQLPEDSQALNIDQKLQLYQYYMALISDPIMKVEYARQLQQLYGIDSRQLKKKTLKNDLQSISMLEFKQLQSSQRYLSSLPKMCNYRQKYELQKYVLK